jgi:hypothetical protein
MIPLDHDGIFIVAAYAAVTIGVLGLIVYAALDARRVKSRLATLDAQGVRRRLVDQDRRDVARVAVEAIGEDANQPRQHDQRHEQQDDALHGELAVRRS